MALRALIWDIDGTVAETERDGHRVAFNQAFEALGMPWHWGVATYGELLRVAGGRERLLHFMAGRADAPADATVRSVLAQALHERKGVCYERIVESGSIVLRPGVRRLMDEAAQAGMPMAIATTTGSANVQALFAAHFGDRWRERFAAVVCAEQAPLKKPHPQAYRLVLQQLDLKADEVFALEDSPAGLAAARAAGIVCGITRSAYFADEFFAGAAWVHGDLDQPLTMTLPRLQAALSAKIGR